MSNQRDLLDSHCRDRSLQVSDQEFESLFCVRCRNSDCTRANWGRDLFQSRVLTQEERLLNPQQVDPAGYEALADFANMFQEAMRLEVSDRKGDWTIPEIPVTDGRTVTSDSSISDAVDDAVRALGKPPGQEPDKKPEEKPPVGRASHGERIDDSGVAAEAEQEFEHEAPEPASAPLQPAQAEPPLRVAPAPPTPASRNTPASQDGMMVGPAPSITEEDKPDPWAPPKDRKVAPGATIRMGGGSDD